MLECWSVEESIDGDWMSYEGYKRMHGCMFIKLIVANCKIE